MSMVNSLFGRSSTNFSNVPGCTSSSAVYEIRTVFEFLILEEKDITFPLCPGFTKKRTSCWLNHSENSIYCPVFISTCNAKLPFNLKRFPAGYNKYCKIIVKYKVSRTSYQNKIDEIGRTRCVSFQTGTPCFLAFRWMRLLKGPVPKRIKERMMSFSKG